MQRPLTLRALGPLARLGIVGLVLTLVGGTAASGIYLAVHHGDRDGVDNLSINDVRAHYHGIVSPAPLLKALGDNHPETLASEKRQILIDWLQGDAATLSQRYDDLDLGANAPSEIIAADCMSCHARAATAEDAYPEMPLEYWDDVRTLAVSRDIQPVDTEILLASTHTHALGMSTVGIAIAILALLTSWPRRLIGPVVGLCGLGLFADLGGWWLTRMNPDFAGMVVAGGVAYNGAVTLLAALVLLDLCMPRPREPKTPATS